LSTQVTTNALKEIYYEDFMKLLLGDFEANQAIASADRQS